MEKTTIAMCLLIGLLLVGGVGVYPYERVSYGGGDVIINNIRDVLKYDCVDVEPETIIINGQYYSKATPNHKTPCSLVYGGGFE